MAETPPVTLRLPLNLRERLVQAANANDRTLTTEAIEAIRRHVELPPTDTPVVLDDIRELLEEIERSGKAEGVPPELLAEMVRVVSACVERTQQRHLRRLAEVIYGTANVADVTAERFQAAVEAEVQRRGHTSTDRRRRRAQ